MTQAKPGSKSSPVAGSGSKNSTSARDAPPQEPFSGPKSRAIDPQGTPPVNTSGDDTPYPDLKPKPETDTIAKRLAAATSL